jgi:2-dehydropantoate 2-reductase
MHANEMTSITHPWQSTSRTRHSCAVRLPIGDVRTVDEVGGRLEQLSRRSARLPRRRASNFRAMAVEIIAMVVNTANRTFSERLEPTGYSSLYDDLTNGRRMKLEALHGTVVRLAHRHEIPVPVSETIYAILRPWAVRIEIAAL